MEIYFVAVRGGNTLFASGTFVLIGTFKHLANLSLKLQERIQENIEQRLPFIFSTCFHVFVSINKNISHSSMPNQKDYHALL